MLRVAFVLRSTEVHPEFCGLSFSSSSLRNPLLLGVIALAFLP